MNIYSVVLLIIMTINKNVVKTCQKLVFMLSIVRS